MPNYPSTTRTHPIANPGVGCIGVHCADHTPIPLPPVTFYRPRHRRGVFTSAHYDLDSLAPEYPGGKHLSWEFLLMEGPSTAQREFGDWSE